MTQPSSGTSEQSQEAAGRARRHRFGPLARLDRIPVWPYERKLLWVVGAGYFFAFFDIVTISFAAPVAKSTVTLSVTSSLIGYIIGAFADATVSDKWGRRLSLGLSVGVFSLGTVLAAASTNVTELIIFRFIAGLGIGAEIASVTTYIGELSPAPPAGSVHQLGNHRCLCWLRGCALHRPRAGAELCQWLADPVPDRRARRSDHPVHAA
jgi:hypothetical protein